MTIGISGPRSGGSRATDGAPICAHPSQGRLISVELQRHSPTIQPIPSIQWYPRYLRIRVLVDATAGDRGLTRIIASDECGREVTTYPVKMGHFYGDEGDARRTFGGPGRDDVVGETLR
ncbi:hypothetical protein R3P38DRAFT_2763457 [Favolaschia claudopus]|uniref:Uncharacterized protein n=1 Tax=Favolaschia claudopus TaxID=2862362 RepID=A0AAW0DG83_9AGAR